MSLNLRGGVMVRVAPVVLLVLSLAASSRLAEAQSTTATLISVVRDSTGAVAPGARGRARSIRRGFDGRGGSGGAGEGAQYSDGIQPQRFHRWDGSVSDSEFASGGLLGGGGEGRLPAVCARRRHSGGEPECARGRDADGGGSLGDG